MFSLAFAAATMVAGGLAFTFGMNSTDVVNVTGYGPFDGIWLPRDYCFLGTILAACGTGLICFTAAWVMLLYRHGSAGLPSRQWIWCSLVLLFGLIGLGVGVPVCFSQQSQKFTRSDINSAQTQVAVFLVLHGEGKDITAMTTGDYKQRDASRKKTDSYQMMSFRTSSTICHDEGYITVKGAISSSLKTTVLRMDGIFVGGGVVKTQLNPPKEIGFTARLIRRGDNLWLIDEVMFEDL